MQANYGENEIKFLLQKVRIFNPDIGTYQIFAITDNFDYAVKLSNGKILLKLEELQDDERDALIAERLQEIANRFVSSTIPTTSQQHTTTESKQATPQTQPAKKKSSIGKTILIIIIVIIVIIGGLIFINNTNHNSSGYNSGSSYQEKVMTVEEIERSQPKKFLSANGTYNENFWGNKIKIQGRIKNSATVAIYKDAVIKVTYYSKTKTVLGSENYTIYEVFSPHSTKNFELKVTKYKNVNSIGLDIVNAIAY
ncbi:hypothetical protein [Flavobacterium tibetense]|uniref:Uncharacterized protein n=1 Tax=Flavobacterium tibetense TaxID=2233533 RepID=A0A365NZA7_9FLAO|nr:hypothetical protein [Flavobacterium tibetense]RBA27578.1 hypothetical protein DPN68_11415 [Flavobacterium tibetense]